MNKKKYALVNGWVGLSVGTVLFISIMIFSYILYKGSGNLNMSFITMKPSGFPMGLEGGIYPALIGTLCFAGVGTVGALVLALPVSIYNQFYSGNPYFRHLIQRAIGILHGVPSILLGLFGYSFFVLYLDFGLSILSGGLVLALMIFPMMEIRFEKIFKELGNAYKMAAYGLGVNRVFYLIHMVIPLTYKELLSAITLSTSFAMGATAPIMLTGAVFYADVPKSMFSPAMALPLHLYMLLGESISYEKAFATASVLILLLFIINLLSWSIVMDWRHQNG